MSGWGKNRANRFPWPRKTLTSRRSRDADSLSFAKKRMRRKQNRLRGALQEVSDSELHLAPLTAWNERATGAKYLRYRLPLLLARVPRPRLHGHPVPCAEGGRPERFDPIHGSSSNPCV